MSQRQPLLQGQQKKSGDDLIILKNTDEKKRFFYYILFIFPCLLNLIVQFVFIIFLKVKYASIFSKHDKDVMIGYTVYIVVMMVLTIALLIYVIRTYKKSGQFGYLGGHEKIVQIGILLFLFINMIMPAIMTLAGGNTEIQHFIASVKTIPDTAGKNFIRGMLVYNFSLAIVGLLLMAIITIMAFLSSGSGGEVVVFIVAALGGGIYTLYRAGKNLFS